MKKTFIMVLSLAISLVMTAGNITPEQALKQAQHFVSKRLETGHGPQLASGVAPTLTMAGRVSDLYVFNVADGNGFVVVSNDDRTEAILGYGNSGNLDPDNIPENMQAWLQGYADEIAWLNSHDAEVMNLPRKTAIKTPINPLMKTHWNQDAPYNDLCPYYGVTSSGNVVYSTTGGSGYQHCATGCVATAMAQAMYYNKWPESATESIPSYEWQGYTLGPITGMVFDWNNMQLNYTGSETDAQKTAVATLMEYCGYSLAMGYGPSSSATTSKIANVLKTYFDYSTTTTFLSRSNYSYENWINLIYNELYEKRIVVYCGQSAGGGHAFICDGYQGEDYFHINWGWGGMSDNYFKLSALDPEAQGIGGSSSDDGFHFGQGAIVGIQKNGGTGTVLNVPASDYNLTLNSISVDKSSASIGELVNVTFNITNSGSDEYDGDIWIYVKSIGLISGKTFLIPAGETKDCVVPFTPSKYTGTYTIQGYKPNDMGSYSLINNKTAQLTVTSGSSNPTTDNITLGRTLIVENSEDNNFFGNMLKGELTITNPNSSYSYKGTYQFDIYDASYQVKWRFNSVITIPANSSMVVPFEMEGANINSEYLLCVIYIKNGNWANWDDMGWYTCKPGIVLYAADGTKTVTKPTGTSLVAPSNALAVDVSGTGITSITPNSLANTVYIYSGTKPNGLNGKNAIAYDGTDYTAENIALTDNNEFYSPVDFYAQSIEFNYAFTVAADGTNGWNTIMLPYDVTSVTADGTEIDWFHSSSDTGKNFWLKKFTNDDPGNVYFDFANEMKANTPYIVAFPGNKWGPSWDMSSKVLKFIGENVTVHKGGTLSNITGGNYRFVGTNIQDNTPDIYCLNANGNKFVLTNGSGPFRAYFKPGMFDRAISSLSIHSGNGGTTEIPFNVQRSTFNVDNGYYNLNGQRVEKLTKGIFITNGKLVIIK